MMLFGQVYDRFGRGCCFFDCCFHNVCVCFVVLYFTGVFEFLLFLCNGIFTHRTEGGKCSMEVLPGRAIDTSFFDCMAVSVSVADLGALATDDLSCFAVTREMVFKFIAVKACYKFSELFFLTL